MTSEPRCSNLVTALRMTAAFRVARPPPNFDLEGWACEILRLARASAIHSSGSARGWPSYASRAKCRPLLKHAADSRARCAVTITSSWKRQAIRTIQTRDPGTTWSANRSRRCCAEDLGPHVALADRRQGLCVFAPVVICEEVSDLGARPRTAGPIWKQT